jgi:hypothetical protein
VITPWVDTLSAAAPTAGLAAAACTYLAMIALTTVVAALHPEAERRADARKVLDLLLAPARRRRK